MNGIYIVRFSVWACGIETADEWRQWAAGTREMGYGNEGPDISYTDSMFRRRLSQVSKMTVQVVHDLLPLDENIKMFFLSFRGEISKQLKINRMVLEDKSLMPAVFSLSVFNAPIALASIAFGLKGGYSTLYPNSFASGFTAVKAALLGGTDERIVFVYADEEVPQEYKNIIADNAPPFAFAMILSRFPESSSIPLSLISPYENETPQGLLKNLVLCRELNATS
ncbi:MAG: beta-ketoacyl synthase chain length factor [Treponema sp.]|jgi:hypothetical protein|nr:beta-ketoacyl synthase chain length factor [Treponema sp.]